MSSADFVRWASIEGLHNLKKKYEKFESLPQASISTIEGELKHFTLLPANATVTYSSKIKLHGANNSIVLKSDGDVIYQSRNSLLDPSAKSSGHGFAYWAQQNLALFKGMKSKIEPLGFGKYVYFSTLTAHRI